MAQSPVLVRGEARDLTDEELLPLTEGDALSDQIQEFTAAEVAVMEEEGTEVVIEGEVDAKDGEVFFQYGEESGAMIRGKMRDHTMQADKVYLYKGDGTPAMVRRDWVPNYLKKMMDGKKVFFTRPPRLKAKPTIPCPREGCRKMLYTPTLARRHYQFKHSQDYQDELENRRIETEERRIAAEERTAKLLEAIALNGGMNPQVLASVANFRVADTMPNDEWNKRDILNWMRENEWPMSPSVMGQPKERLLELLFADTEEQGQEEATDGV